MVCCLVKGIGREVKLPDQEGARSLQELEQIVLGHFTVVEYLCRQARTYGFAPVNRCDRAPPIVMLQKMVATSHADRLEAMSTQSCDDLATGDARESGHPSTQTRCTPMNS